MKRTTRVCGVICLAIVCVVLKASASNHGAFSGFVGCKIDPDVCQPYEFCVNDCLFGSCQSSQYYDEYCYDDLTTSQLLDLQVEVTKLLDSGQTWRDISTQCVVGNILLSYRSGLPYDPSFCESSPIRQEIEDQISAAAARLLEKYFSDYYGDQLPEYPRQLSDIDYTDSVDLTDYPYPTVGDSYPTNEQPVIGDFRTHSNEGLIRNSDNYFPMDKKDEYVQVHKYLKSHKRDPSLGLQRYNQDYYANDYPATSQEFDSYYDDGSYDLDEKKYPYLGPSEADYDDLINNLSYDELMLLYKYLIGEDLSYSKDVEGIGSDTSEEELPKVTDLVPVDGVSNDERKLIAEDMMQTDEEEDLTMTPEDAKLLGDVLEGDVKVNDLSDDEVAKLSVYVDDILNALTRDVPARPEDGNQLKDVVDGGDLNNDGFHNENFDEDDNSPAGRFAQALFGNKQINDGRLVEKSMEKPDEDMLETKRGDTEEGEMDVKDYSFDTNTPKSVPTAENKFGLVQNDKFWLKTKQKDVKAPDAAVLLEALEKILNASKLLTQNMDQFKVGEGNITVVLDPSNKSGYNASTIAEIAVKHRSELANQTGVLIEDGGVGEGSDILSVTAIKHTSPKYFVLTFVLCGAVAGIVLAVIIIYIFRRHVQSKEKLQQLGGTGEMEAEASKDYQDLCRQRMQSKTSDKPEPVHVAARIGSDGGVPRSTHSSRSSTSSWSEEPAVTNMDISTGHIVLSYMEDHLKNKGRLDQEWEGLVAYEAEPNSTAIASEPANMRKNRYSDVLPYDHSRVVLNGTTNVSGSDYINASTITDHDPRNPAYIATQGPLPHTVADFWQMVWEQGSVVIVNLTKLTEGGNAMCHRYWPEEGSDLYHIYEVHLVSEHIWCDDYLVRSFYLKNLQTNETRTVTQFHFLSWYDLGVPSSFKALLDFRRKVNKSYRGRSCPIAVHCSDGSGRSGTYCLIDMVLNRMSKGAKEIDIAATLEHIRDQRMQMVKTKQQFEFALACVAEEVTAILKALPQ